ncbi:MAG: hypothetical protein QXK89_03005 [Candidatus Bathyarchaeia archaeon]
MRKSLRRSNRGQLIVILAILMSIAVLSVAFSIHQMSGQRQQLKYEPVKETVLAITSDLRRTLVIALREATIIYYSTLPQDLSSSIGNIIEAKAKFIEILNNWKNNITILYSQLGVNVNFIYAELFIEWNSFSGFSHGSIAFTLDIDAYRFKGWTGKITKYIELTIIPNTVELISLTQIKLKFTLMEDGKPITNLMPEHLQGYVLGNESDWIQTGINSLTYLGKGVYAVSLSLSQGTINMFNLSVILRAVTPGDSIIVSARYQGESFNWFLLHLGGPKGEKGKPKDVMLLPWGLWNPDIQGEYTPQFSHGRDKQWALIYSPPTPKINYSLAKYVNITIYAKPVPPQGKRSISVSLYFITENGTLCTIAVSDPQPFPREGWYRFGPLYFEDEFKNPPYNSTVPENSRLVLKVEVTWLRQPYGTFHLQYGGEYPSKIEFVI